MLANMFILLLRTVMDRYRPPSRGSVAIFNDSGTVHTRARTVLEKFLTPV